MRDDEIAVMVCSPATAKKFVAEEPEVIDSCIIWSQILDDVAFVVSRDEFINWLEEHEEYNIDAEEGEE